jgi:hypothetical protein
MPMDLVEFAQINHVLFRLFWLTPLLLEENAKKIALNAYAMNGVMITLK